MKLTLLRHGHTPLIGRFCGKSDPELTPEGLAEVQARCDGRSWSFVASSPARRCLSFASDLSEQVFVDDGFWEMDFGSWEARRTEEIWKEESGALKAFWHDPHRSPPPGGESWGAFADRVAEACTRLHAKASAEGAEDALLIVHAGVMRAVLERFIGIPLAASWNISLPPASILELEFSADPKGGALRAMLAGLHT